MLDLSVDEDEEARLVVKSSSMMPQEILLCDFLKKKEEVVELVVAMILCCQKSTKDTSKDAKHMDMKDKSIIQLCQQLGYSIKPSFNEQSDKFIRCYSVISDEVLVRKVNIIGVNNYRNRCSVVYNDPMKGYAHAEIFVRGNYESMRGTIKLSSKEEIVYKQLISRYRLEGLSPEIFAKRELNLDELMEFYEAFRMAQET